MKSAGAGWAAELLAMFVIGFVVAAALAIGVWYLWARPSATAELRRTRAALQDKEAALQECAAARDQFTQQMEKIRAQNKDLDTKLRDALAGWGRCIKSKPAVPAEQQPPQTSNP